MSTKSQEGNSGEAPSMERLLAAKGLVQRVLASDGIKYAVEEGKGFVDFILEGPEDLRKAAEKLKAEGFDHVVSLTAVDYPKKGVIRLVYHVSSYLNPEIAGAIIGLGLEVERRERPKAPSLSDIWVSAEFMEREVYEFFGIEFEGHPDLRPLLLVPSLAEKHPLRKDFVVKEEGIYEGVPEHVRRG